MDSILLFLNLLRDAEACIKLQHTADGQGYDPFLSSARPPAEQLHTHHDKRQHKAAASQKLLATQAKKRNVVPLVFCLSLHECEHQHAYAEDIHPCHWIHDKPCRTDKYQYSSNAEDDVL